MDRLCLQSVRLYFFYLFALRVKTRRYFYRLFLFYDTWSLNFGLLFGWNNFNIFVDCLWLWSNNDILLQNRWLIRLTLLRLVLLEIFLFQKLNFPFFLIHLINVTFDLLDRLSNRLYRFRYFKLLSNSTWLNLRWRLTVW